MGNNPILFNDKLGDTIRLAKMADFQGKTLKSHHSKADKSFDLLREGQDIKDKNVWTITPHYDKNDKLVGYVAGRLGKGDDYAIEYYLDKGDFTEFSRNLDNYQTASNLFLMNGPPSPSELAFMSGLSNGSISETFDGLGQMWSDALNDPVWVATALLATGQAGVGMMSSGGPRITRSVGAAPKGFKSWPFKKATASQIAIANCEKDAMKIQGIVGGDILTVSNPRGLQLGPVKYGNSEISGWYHHKAVIRGNTVFDRITGEKGMPLEQYRSLWEYGDDLIFSTTK